MAVQQVIDVTDDFNADSASVTDIGGFDFAVVQLVSPTGTVNFTHTNDSGDVAGVSDGNYVSAANFITVTGTNLATNTGVTSLATGGLVKFDGIGRYLKLSGSSVTATKVLIRLYKQV